MAFMYTRTMGRAFLTMALTLFSGQLCNITGVAIAGAVTASLWQPSQPVFTLLGAVLLKMESLTLSRCLGILLAAGGCATIVVSSAATKDMASGHNLVVGNFFLLCNCLSTPVCILASKPLLAKGYPKLLLSTASFGVSSILFLLALMLDLGTTALCSHFLHYFFSNLIMHLLLSLCRIIKHTHIHSLAESLVITGDCMFLPEFRIKTRSERIGHFITVFRVSILLVLSLHCHVALSHHSLHQRSEICP